MDLQCAVCHCTPGLQRLITEWAQAAASDSWKDCCKVQITRAAWLFAQPTGRCRLLNASNCFTVHLVVLPVLSLSFWYCMLKINLAWVKFRWSLPLVVGSQNARLARWVSGFKTQSTDIADSRSDRFTSASRDGAVSVKKSDKTLY